MNGGAGEGTVPVVILDQPQLGENIGFAARAMWNCGLSSLRLVRPRDGWPNPKALAASAGADHVIEGAIVFDELAGALADLTHVYAATARPRDQIKRVVTPKAAAAELRGLPAEARPGLLFGAERSGLDNDAVAMAHVVVTVPLNPAFTSLNLAQAVQILAYEWFQSADTTPPDQFVTGASPPATQGALDNFCNRLVDALDRTGFLHVVEKRPVMIRNIRNIFQRADLTEQEVNSLHGVVKSLWMAEPPKRGRDGD